MFHIKTQLRRLYTVSALSSFQIAGASWVALLAARGFSLVEIGVAEGVFHVASLLFEIPSGVISDVFGRKKSMVLSQCMFLLAALVMAFSNSFWGGCAALVLDAMGYNFASGAREALAYDSLKSVGQEDGYLDFSSKEYSIYRIGQASAILCAGLALWMGHRRAYLLDAALGLVCLWCALRLTEVQTEERQFSGTISRRILDCFRETFGFLKNSGASLKLMLWNSLVGAAATLTIFFLQARLQETSLPQGLLGPALFVVSLGGALGARLSVKTAKWNYKRLSLLCVSAVILGVVCSKTPFALLLCLGGFAAGLCDDMLQVRTDAILNDRFPSSQRATLVSVSSLCFSLVMILLSPLAGWFFS